MYIGRGADGPGLWIILGKVWGWMRWIDGIIHMQSFETRACACSYRTGFADLETEGSSWCDDDDDER